MTTPRIYVASLSDYNAGRLHGRWINADQSAEEIQEEIASMLASSKEEPHEEWAIHDYEGFDGIKLSEYEAIERVSMIAELLSENDYPEIVATALEHCGKDADAKDLRDWISDCYAGSYRTLEDWAEEYLDDTGALSEIPEQWRAYFDVERWARDAELGGDIFTVEGGRGVLVFRNV